MAINLSKNRAALLAAWNDVLDDKTPTNWALFGYEGLTNNLRFVSKGASGIEEMMEDLNSGQIMYAFLKVMDPKTSLPKNVLINWQGEGAPNVRKGTCANHVRDVSNFFKGAHVTMNARNEEEVDPQIIIDRVSKATGSAYSFKERAELDNQTGPVGTAYKRVIPKQEINALERDKFWEKEEQEERQRQEEERRLREEEKRNLEEERKRRESEETAKREQKAAERNRTINQLREAERIQEVQESLSRQKLLEDSESEDRERRERAEILRRQRKEEAQQLIAKRTIDARAVFEQNPCALNRRRASYQPNQVQKSEPEPSPAISSNEQTVVKPARKGSLPTWLPGAEDTAQPETNVKNNGAVTNSEQNNCVKIVEEENSIEEEQDWEDDVKHEIIPTAATAVAADKVEPAEPELPPQFINENQNQYSNGDYGLTARALYDYQADDETEISFDPGDIITHIDQIDEGWWQGLGPHGVFGLFPANYVELIK